MDRICKVTETVTSSVNIEVCLLRDDLSENEVNEIIDKIRVLCDIPNQPQELNIKGLAHIFTYKRGQEKPVIEEKRPALCTSALKVGGGIECHLNLQMLFTDTRVEKILKKSKQLSPEECNMIILDITNEIVKLRQWSEALIRILEPDRHRRISAVLLVEKARFIESLRVGSNLVSHPNPLKPLPKDFIQLTNDHFRQFPEYQLIPRGK